MWYVWRRIRALLFFPESPVIVTGNNRVLTSYIRGVFVVSKKNFKQVTLVQIRIFPNRLLWKRPFFHICTLFRILTYVLLTQVTNRVLKEGIRVICVTSEIYFMYRMSVGSLNLFVIGLYHWEGLNYFTKFL